MLEPSARAGCHGVLELSSGTVFGVLAEEPEWESLLRTVSAPPDVYRNYAAPLALVIFVAHRLLVKE